jgi:hypothetical protein
MNAKSKGFGLLAAVVLSLSMFGGALAQQSDSEWVSTELYDPGYGFCVLDIYAVSGSFGVWEFDGFQYNEVTGTSTIEFYGDFYGMGSYGCDVEIYFDGLYGPGGWIDPYYFTAYSLYQQQNVDPMWWGNTGVMSGIYDFNYTLNQVPTLSPGWYEGSIQSFTMNTP